jgi:hypothetical protein
MIDFNTIHDNLQKSKTEIVENKESYVSIISALVNLKELEDIDFERIDSADILELQEEIFTIVTIEHEDGRVQLNPSHPFAMINSIQHKIHGLERKPRKRIPSSYRFL